MIVRLFFRVMAGHDVSNVGWVEEIFTHFARFLGKVRCDARDL